MPNGYNSVIGEGGVKLSHDDKTDSYFIVMENITTIHKEKNSDYLHKDFKDKDIRVLAYKKLLENLRINLKNFTKQERLN